MKIIESLKRRVRKETHLWDKFYPKNKRKIKVTNMTLYEFIYEEKKDRQYKIA